MFYRVKPVFFIYWFTSVDSEIHTRSKSFVLVWMATCGLKITWCTCIFSPVHPALGSFKGKPDLNTSLPVRQTASIFKQPVTKVTNHPNNKVKTDPQKAVDQPRQVHGICPSQLTSSHINLRHVFSDCHRFTVHSFSGRRSSAVSMLMTSQRNWWKQWSCLKACKVITPVIVYFP